MKKENHKNEMKNEENVYENHQKPSGDSSPPIDNKRESKRRNEDNLLAEMKNDLQSVKAELEATKSEAESMKDLMVRRQADFENYKKRALKSQEDFKKFIIKEFALEIIKINDDLLRAVESSSSIKPDETLEASHKSFVDGVGIISKRIEDTLKNFGVEEIDCLNTEFNPNFHEAVEMESSADFSSDTVTKVHVKGFKIDDIVVRTSKVKVSRPEKTSGKTAAEENEKGQCGENCSCG
jgi:molecular chaperone GrpE